MKETRSSAQHSTSHGTFSVGGKELQRAPTNPLWTSSRWIRKTCSKSDLLTVIAAIIDGSVVFRDFKAMLTVLTTFHNSH